MYDRLKKQQEQQQKLQISFDVFEDLRRREKKTDFISSEVTSFMFHITYLKKNRTDSS